MNSDESEEFRMSKEMLEQWIGCLLGGEYKKGRSQLLDYSGGHCCLGVLAEEAGQLFEGRHQGRLETLRSSSALAEAVESIPSEFHAIAFQTRLEGTNDRNRTFNPVAKILLGYMKDMEESPDD